jgi:hypothetical protein
LTISAIGRATRALLGRSIEVSAVFTAHTILITASINCSVDTLLSTFEVFIDNKTCLAYFAAFAINNTFNALRDVTSLAARSFKELVKWADVTSL